ncbi:MAG: chloramphenicol acetyltransferase [Ruminococcus sp.]|nr:chloramphenicol acetyltransferase [Ruminococcus sp.]
MAVEINPKDTTRAYAFEMWMKAPNPMVTLFRTFDVTRLVKISKRKKLKFNMLMCYCIGKAAAGINEFYTLPVADKLMKYDKIAVNVIVKNKSSGVSSCDINYTEDIEKFNADYLNYTVNTAETAEDRDLSADCMVIGTSALIETEIDGAVGMYSGIFNNPFIIWGRYRSKFFRHKLPVSFQFHHTQMDGEQAGRFIENLQTAINTITL